MRRQEKLDELLKNYRVVKVLADKNGCQTIQLRHAVMGRDVVLHSLPQKVSAYETLCSLRAEHLPEMYDVFDCDDGMIALEEFISGLTVAEMMEAQRFSYREAARILYGVCDALDALHARQIIHRDVKPENIMVTGNRVVLLDFNASRRLSGAAHDTVFLGTMGYASPEQFGLTESDARTDIFAAGVLLNVMLTGCHPSQKQAQGRAGRIVARCVRVNPDERYQSARALAAAL